MRTAATTLSAVLACALAAAGCSDSTAPSAGGGEASSGESVLTDSGLEITEIRAGTGDQPGPSDMVEVHYHGTFEDGTVFDSSVDRGQPATFPLNRVIPCWTEGVGMMRVGGKSRLVCPPSIAYGERGAPPRIPPNATLNFDVELLGIVR